MGIVNIKMENTMEIFVENIQKGYKVKLESGEKVKVMGISKGWFNNSSFLNFSNGEWSCLSNKEKVTVEIN